MAHVKLSDIVEIQHGWAFKGEMFAAPRARMPLIVKPGNFRPTGGLDMTYERTRGYVGEYPSEYELAPGDVLVVMTCQTQGGEILGVPGRVPDDGRTYLHNQRLGRLVVKDGTPADLDYVYWLFADPRMRHRLVASATGSTVLHTSPSRIGEIVVWLPPIDEQRRIAGVLGALDDKVEHNECTQRRLFRLCETDFQQAFASAPTETVLGELVDVVDCLHSKKPERREYGEPLLQVWNIRADGLLDMSDTYCISSDDYEEWTRRVEVQDGDCVITNVGRIGAVAQVIGDFRAALGRNMTGLRVRSEFPFPTFVATALLSRQVRQEIDALTDAGTVMGALNVRSIPKLRLPAADRAAVERFEVIHRRNWQLRRRLLDEASRLTATRNTLLPKLISGEIRVPDSYDSRDVLGPVAEAAGRAV